MPAWSRRKFLALAAGLTFAGLTLSGRAQAELAHADSGRAREDGSIEPRRIDLAPREEVYALTGGFDIALNHKLEEALMRGVGIVFVQEFELVRPRDYWFAEGITEARRTLRLSYNALLRSFAVQGPGGTRNYDTLADALYAVGTLADWAVVDKRLIRKKTYYRAQVRQYVDLSQLPKPLQVNAFASDRWQMDSGPVSWTFKP